MISRYFAALLLGVAALLPAARAATNTVLITEFVASNDAGITDEDGSHPDWLELYNPGTEPVNMDGWYLTDKPTKPTKWRIPAVTLPPKGFLVIFCSSKDRKDPTKPLHTNFKLGASGDYLGLIEPDGATVSFEYSPVYPPQQTDVSYGIPFSNDEPLMAKRVYFADPTPGAPNADASDMGPLILSARHTPNVPNAGQDLNVTTMVLPMMNPVDTVTMTYRVNYGAHVTVPMTAGTDGHYTATIPGSAYAAGDMVRYFVTATDTGGPSSRHPAFLSPEGSPEYEGTMVADPAVQTQLPVLYWWVNNPSAADTKTGTRASVFYLDRFYDNIFVRLRGFSSAAWPKKNYKFEFNKGFDFTWDPNQPVVDEMNVQSTYSDKSYMRQVLAWETFEDAGVPGVHSFHMRVQQNGSFFSVAEWVEHPDKNFLRRIGLDENGALYKMYNPFNSSELGEDMVEKKTRKDEDASDLQAAIDGVQQTGPALTTYMFDNINVPEMVNYLAATVIMHDLDNDNKNYFVYRDTEGTGEWQMLPWDKDLTFGRNGNNQGVLNDDVWGDRDPPSHPMLAAGHRIISALRREPTTQAMYLRRLRTLMDRQLQPPDTPVADRIFEKRVDELATLIGPDVLLDRAKWGNPYGEDQDLETAVSIMKTNYFEPRRVHLFVTHSIHGIGSVPDAQAAVPALELGVGHTVPEGGNPDEEYIEVHNPTSAAVDISGWKLGGAVSLTFQPGVVVPANGVMYVSPNVNAFRARQTPPKGGMGLFVQGNYSGRVTGNGGAVTLTTDTGIPIAVTPYTTGDLQRALSIAAGLTEATPTDVARLDLVADGGSEGVVDVQDVAALTVLLHPVAE